MLYLRTCNLLYASHLVKQMFSSRHISFNFRTKISIGVLNKNAKFGEYRSIIIVEINANYVGVGLNTSANVICAPAYTVGPRFNAIY